MAPPFCDIRLKSNKMNEIISLLGNSKNVNKMIVIIG